MNYLFFNGLLLISGLLALLFFAFGVMRLLTQLAHLVKSDHPSKALIFPLRGIAGMAQIFFWGWWSAFCVIITIKYTQPSGVAWPWLYWVSGFIWCAAPVGCLAYQGRSGGRTLIDAPKTRKGSTACALVAIVAFIVFAYSPALIAPPFGWILKPLGLYEYSVPKKELDAQLAPAVRQSVDAFFAGYELFNTANEVSQELEFSQDRMAELEKVKDLLNHSKNRLAECDPIILNDIYRGWGDVVTDKFIPAVGFILSGLSREENRSDMETGDALMSELGDWLQNNWNAILQTLNDRYGLDIKM